MRIEILVGSEEPIISSLKSAKVVIGSGDNCDIILDTSGISRKHIAVITEGDQYFVIDQGSTNGSFINEERLVPGKKVEFTSFFPVRLGDNVLLSLLSDEEDIDYSIPVPKEKTSPNMQTPREREDSTTVIKLNDLKKVRTENLVLERNQKREVRKKATPPPVPTTPKKKIGIVPLACILLIGVAGYYNFVLKKTEVDNEPVAEFGKVIKVEKVEKPVEVSETVPTDDLPKKETFTNLLNDIKCVTDVEKYLCNTIPNANTGLWGASQVGLSLKAVIDGTPYIEDAKKFLRPPKQGDENAIAAFNDLVNKTAAYIFIMRNMPLLDEAQLGDNTLSIGFFSSASGESKLEFVVSFYPKVFNREKPKMKEQDLFHIRNSGEAGLATFKRFFTVY